MIEMSAGRNAGRTWFIFDVYPIIPMEYLRLRVEVGITTVAVCIPVEKCMSLTLISTGLLTTAPKSWLFFLCMLAHGCMNLSSAWQNLLPSTAFSNWMARIAMVFILIGICAPPPFFFNPQTQENSVCTEKNSRSNKESGFDIWLPSSSCSRVL